MSRLIVFAGLPGVGKTTQARSLADALRAVYLRLDTLEAPFIRMANNNDLKDYGYQAIAHLAGDNLELGRTVIIDAVSQPHAPHPGHIPGPGRTASGEAHPIRMCAPGRG